MGKLLQLILTIFTEEKTLMQIFGKLFKNEIKKFGRQFNPERLIKNLIPGYQLKKLTPERLVRKLKSKLNPQELSKLLDMIRKRNNGRENTNVDLLINYEGAIKLSSSFLQYGIFETTGNDPNEGKLTLAIDNKEYDMGIVKARIWIAMTQAIGKNGSGAGSVLWDTLWYNKRRTSLDTGGVVKSIERMVARRKSTLIQVARNQKYIKIAHKQKTFSRARRMRTQRRQK